MVSFSQKKRQDEKASVVGTGVETPRHSYANADSLAQSLLFARLRYPLKRFTPLATMGRMCWLPNALPRLHQAVKCNFDLCHTIDT